jgi:hypothetical protein
VLYALWVLVTSVDTKTKHTKGKKEKPHITLTLYFISFVFPFLTLAFFNAEEIIIMTFVYKKYKGFNVMIFFCISLQLALSNGYARF